MSATASAPITVTGVARTLGRTGAHVLPVSLGGEGILRTTGRAREAVPVILEALRLGVRYCDTAPAYQQSQDYYGEAFREAGPGARERVFLASKVHERGRDRGLRLLDDSLERLGTDHHDPAILVEAMRRHPFDSVLCALNPADPARLPFRSTVIAEARRRGMGVVG